MKENILKYINELEGFKTFIKNAHWASKNMQTHKLYDDIADSVSSIQDKISEISQGLFGKINKGELKPVSYGELGEQEFLSKLLETSKTFYSSIKEGDDYIGLRSEMETFIGEISQFKYLMSLALNEHKTNKQIIIKESAKNRLFTESAIMDKERGKNARAFRIALKNALESGNYDFDEETQKIILDDFTYTLGKKFAETKDGEPIPLHYTFNSVMKYIETHLQPTDNYLFEIYL